MSASRIPELDAMRGVALLGILLGNVMWFSGFAVADPDARAALAFPAVDAVVEWLVHTFVDGKFYSLFSLLFGAGFALALRRRSAASFGRRLAVLFAIGMLHGALLWFGDIVSLYAVTGVALLAVVSWSARRLFIASMVCLAAPAVLGGVWLLADVLWGTAVGVGYGPASKLGAFASGSYAEVLDANWDFLVDRWYLAVISWRFPRILGMFLLGVAAVRSGLPRRRADLVALARRILPVAVLANAAFGAMGGGAPPRPPTALGVGGRHHCVHRRADRCDRLRGRDCDAVAPRCVALAVPAGGRTHVPEQLRGAVDRDGGAVVWVRARCLGAHRGDRGRADRARGVHHAGDPQSRVAAAVRAGPVGVGLP